ncbi:DUF4277 domain-containing protein [Streptomyces lannensis]|uniref:DUF4277 domain-containing protein n=1 Tax=Streptomyces lannensis TaxID=766498 RepID=UPI003CD064D3
MSPGSSTRCVRGDASALVTHGQVIEALVANRLTSPAPLVRVEDWAKCWAVEEVFGIESGLLNDDRLARALDAIAPHLEHIAGTVGARAIGEFGIDVARMHWDMTSMSVHGAFPVEGQDEDFPHHRLRASQGLALRSEAGPGRACGVGRRRHPAPCPGLRRWCGRGQPGRRCDEGPAGHGRATRLPDGRRLQAGVLRQRGRPAGGRGSVHRPGPGRAGQGRGLWRSRPRAGHRRGLDAGPGGRQARRAARDLPRAGGHPHLDRAPQERSAPPRATDPGPLHREHRRPASRPGTNAWPRPPRT